MSDIAIRVQNLSKLYQIGALQQRHDTLRDALTSRFRRRHQSAASQTVPSNELWALKDVSFEITRGEVVGIIGRNGAGKSTLLKILSRITEPTSGRVALHGRVASLLEVGTGFHPELTGRENIYLNGAILGMKRREIDRKFDEIVEFAEIERFLDTPVKRYSSGMYVRLAFAVAAHLEPEILLVDEVLAVGDAQFQKKALGKMGAVVKEGRTVLFVSHNMTAIRSLCASAILLRSGSICRCGAASDVINQYLSFAWQARLDQTWESADQAPGNDEVRVRHISVAPVTNTTTHEISVETPLHVVFQFWALRPATINLSMHVKQINGETVFAVASPKVEIEAGMVAFGCDIPGNFMNDGVYTIQMMIVRDSQAIFVLDDGVVFEVHDIARAGNWWGKWPGAVRPKFHWKCSLNPIAHNEN